MQQTLIKINPSSSGADFGRVQPQLVLFKCHERIISCVSFILYISYFTKNLETQEVPCWPIDFQPKVTSFPLGFGFSTHF